MTRSLTAVLPALVTDGTRLPSGVTVLVTGSVALRRNRRSSRRPVLALELSESCLAVASRCGGRGLQGGVPGRLRLRRRRPAPARPGGRAGCPTAAAPAPALSAAGAERELPAGAQVRTGTRACWSMSARVSAVSTKLSSVHRVRRPVGQRRRLRPSASAVKSRTVVMSLRVALGLVGREQLLGARVGGSCGRTSSVVASRSGSAEPCAWSARTSSRRVRGLVEQGLALAGVARVHGVADLLDAALDRVERVARQGTGGGGGHAGGAADDDEARRRAVPSRRLRLVACAWARVGVRRAARDQLGLGSRHQPRAGGRSRTRRVGSTSGCVRSTSTVAKQIGVALGDGRRSPCPRAPFRTPRPPAARGRGVSWLRFLRCGRS